LRIRPYRTSENKSEGVVLTLVDIDALKSQVHESREYAEAIVETVREPILVLDHELRVKAANPAFYETFRTSAGETENRFLYELRQGEWNIPTLRQLLEEVLPQKKELRDFLVEQDFSGLGSRAMMLNAKQIVRDREAASLILLAIEDITEQHRAQQVIARQALLLDSAHDAIVVRNEDSIIQYWNRGAEKLYGWTREEALGQPISRILKTVYPTPLEEIQAALIRDGHWQGELKQVTRDGAPVIVASNWTLEQESVSGQMTWLEISRDITRRRQAEQSVRALSQQLFALQDEERRRFARELHDGPAQTLSALALNLAVVRQSEGGLGEKAQKALTDAFALAGAASTELRTMSYLMHPPLLERGLTAALEWYVKGFGERSGIAARLSLPPELGSLPEEVETALFRIVQEGLTNVHRHTKSATVDISLSLDSKSITLEIKDAGQGLPPEILAAARGEGFPLGVGLRGIRGRVARLGGQLEIESDSQGTTLRAVLPIEPAGPFAIPL
jgi:PAS domain S-box-containing protein